jgi:hypothetical protein
MRTCCTGGDVEREGALVLPDCPGREGRYDGLADFQKQYVTDFDDSCPRRGSLRLDAGTTGTGGDVER